MLTDNVFRSNNHHEPGNNSSRKNQDIGANNNVIMLTAVIVCQFQLAILCYKNYSIVKKVGRSHKKLGKSPKLYDVGCKCSHRTRVICRE